MKNLRMILGGALAAAVILGMMYVFFHIPVDQLQRIADRLGFWGPVLIVALVALTHIIAPFSGAPVFLASIRLYGFDRTSLYLYAGSMVSAVISFWIARKLGRAFVKRLAGDDAMKKMDAISLREEKSMLIVSRLFGYGIFEIVSYALGFTAIGFMHYMSYTIVLSAVPSFVMYFLFNHVSFVGAKGYILWFLSLSVSGLIFSKWLLSLYRHEHEAKKR